MKQNHGSRRNDWTDLIRELEDVPPRVGLYDHASDVLCSAAKNKKHLLYQLLVEAKDENGTPMLVIKIRSTGRVIYLVRGDIL